MSQEGWNQMILKVLSNPKHSMILGVPEEVKAPNPCRWVITSKSCLWIWMLKKVSGSCACRDKLDPLTGQNLWKQAAEGKWECTNLACANIAWFWQILCCVGTPCDFCMLSPGTATRSVQVVLKYKPQSRQRKWRTSAGFNTDCRVCISRQRQKSSTTWNLSNKELQEGFQPVSRGLQRFQAEVPRWHSVPHPMEELSLCRINPYCEKE